MLLTKGFEVEMYTGTPAGEVVGFSDRAAVALPNIAKEPDRRNVEYITSPQRRYEQLLCELVRPRTQLRRFLAQFGDYTLLPGSTLVLGGSDHFDRSDPTNPYHAYIEETYGTRVVTASIHINIGLDTPAQILQACRLLRAEAPLYLALSASSPFLDGAVTGAHSTRWQMFPTTPKQVPFFIDHRHFIRWTHEQLRLGTMQNVRHLWTSVRPNGPDRPYDINRVEVRICDLIADPLVILAVTALIEARLHQMLAQPETLDPLTGPFSNEDLMAITDQNEQAVAARSLEAAVIDWQSGESVAVSSWLEHLLAEAWVTAYPLGFSCFLTPLQKVLREGNEAQGWLRQIAQGWSVADTYRHSIERLREQELELEDTLCQQLIA